MVTLTGSTSGESGLVVLEELVRARSTGRPSEDVALCTRDFAAVVDGATTAAPRCSCCREAPGLLAARCVSTTVRGLEPSTSLSEALTVLVRDLRRATADLECRGRAWQASAAILSRHRREVWLIGDVQARVDGQTHRSDKYVDDIAASFRAAYIQAEMLAGAPAQEAALRGRALIVPLLEAIVTFRNNPRAGAYGFAALAPEEVPESLCRVVLLKETEEVVLASDGYPSVLDDLGSTEAALAEVLSADPDMIHTPRTKGRAPGAESFDDRTFLRIQCPVAPAPS